MSLSYSPSTGGFFHAELHDELPADAQPVSEAKHRELLAAQAAGARIVAGPDGRPTLVRPTPVKLAQRRTNAMMQVKAEAARRIEVIAPIWRQLNALRSAAGAGDPIFARIDAIRAAGDALEVAIADLTVTALAQLDVAADCHWPA